MAKRLTLGIGAVALLALVAPIASGHWSPRLVWNASPSAPEGLYAVRPGAPIRVGDMVIARTPIAFRALADARHYIPADVPLVKQVVAASGDQICALGDALYRNGVWLAARRRTDGAGRPMPGWQGCRRLGPDQYFLLMAASALSFDGRYFGVTARRDIIGRARLLWAR